MAADNLDPVPAEATADADDLDVAASVTPASPEGSMDSAGLVDSVGSVTEPAATAPVDDLADVWAVGIPAPPPRRKLHISRRVKVLSLTGVVVAALIVGLVVWSPWQPNPPAGVRAVSPTATSVVVSWHVSSGNIAGPSRYLVLRNGSQVGSVAAGIVSWTDHGLAPGATYHYTVVAAGLVDSAPSATATVTTMTPRPVRLTAHPTYTTVGLRWAPSPLGPAPDHYVISNGTAVVATVPGTATSYTDKGQSPGTSFTYTVVAQWGDYLSGPSAAASGATIAAPLNAEVPVRIDTTSSPGPSWGPIVDGYHWDDTWSAAPACTTRGCPVITTTISVGPSGTFANASLPVTLHGSGTGYSGTATAKITGCETGTRVIPYTNTITLALTPTKGKVRNGAWTAWTGTMTMTAPYMDEGGGYYCPSANWTFAVSSRLSARRLSAPRRAATATACARAPRTRPPSMGPVAVLLYVGYPSGWRLVIATGRTEALYGADESPPHDPGDGKATADNGGDGRVQEVPRHPRLHPACAQLGQVQLLDLFAALARCLGPGRFKRLLPGLALLAGCGPHFVHVRELIARSVESDALRLRSRAGTRLEPGPRGDSSQPRDKHLAGDESVSAGDRAARVTVAGTEADAEFKAPPTRVNSPAGTKHVRAFGVHVTMTGHRSVYLPECFGLPVEHA